MIRTARLSKKFEHRLVLDNISLFISEGETLGVVGSNGAGKTTLIRVLGTLLRPSSGTVVIDGVDASKEPLKVRRQIGVVTHTTFLYDELTARENLEFYARLYSLVNAESRIEHLLSQQGLTRRADELVGSFSRGMKQRLSVARALLHDPPVLLLDEPTTGLDADGKVEFCNMIKKANGKTIVLATHDFKEVEELCQKVAVIREGRIMQEFDVKGAGFDEIFEEALSVRNQPRY